VIDAYTLEHDVLPAIRRQILEINTPDATHDRRTASYTQQALFDLLALCAELARRVQVLEVRP
jgi:hypothetical protein